MTMWNETVLDMRKQISNNLAFRHSADDLFDYINSLNEMKIVIDFSGIESISRSFAHQYIVNKDRSTKQIIEHEMPSKIKPMFELVERQRQNLAPSIGQ